MKNYVLPLLFFFCFFNESEQDEEICETCASCSAAISLDVVQRKKREEK